MSKKHNKNKSTPASFNNGTQEQTSSQPQSFYVKEQFTYNDKQKSIIEYGLAKNTKCIYIDGLYGTSKSYLSVLIGLKLLAQKKVNQIIYVRNPVESSTTSKIGALPGLISEKMQPYNQIFFDKLEEFLTKPTIDMLNKEGKLECVPLGFSRGLSWASKFIIVDEAASLTFDDLILLMSRLGEHSKIVFIGDSLNQNDIGAKSGFKKMFDLLSDQESQDNGIYTFKMQSINDIVRSGFVRFLMKKTGKIKV